MTKVDRLERIFYGIGIVVMLGMIAAGAVMRAVAM